MSTFSHSLDRVRVQKLQLVRADVDVTATTQAFHAQPDDGLAALRGLAAAMLFNAAIALFVAGAWELWRIFR